MSGQHARLSFVKIYKILKDKESPSSPQFKEMQTSFLPKMKTKQKPNKSNKQTIAPLTAFRPSSPNSLLSEFIYEFINLFIISPPLREMALANNFLFRIWLLKLKLQQRFFIVFEIFLL